MISGFRSFKCLVCLPAARFRQSLKLELVNCSRINAITLFSFKPNCWFIASNGVLSSHAISIMHEIFHDLNAALRLLFVCLYVHAADLDYKISCCQCSAKKSMNALTTFCWKLRDKYTAHK